MKTQSNSLKRKTPDNIDHTIYPPTKKQRLDNSSPSNAPISHLFPNSSDYTQFKKLFHFIDESQLTINMNVSHCIIKEIAEYATGNFAYCANQECNESISILTHHQSLYNDNLYMNKIGYKYCNVLKKYYCDECMNYTTFCEENALHFGDTHHCYVCDLLLFEDETANDCICWEEYHSCHYCSAKVCDGCWCDGNYNPCEICNKNFCQDCLLDMDTYNCRALSYGDARYVCMDCYDPAIIECNKCKTKYDLWYKGNTSLNKHKNKAKKQKEMKLCVADGCEAYICFNCEEKDRNGKYLMCGSSLDRKCQGKKELGPYCVKHIPNHPSKWPICNSCDYWALQNNSL